MVPAALSVVMASLLPALTPAPAAAEDPAFVDWSGQLPPIARRYEPTSSDDCVAGRESCVRKTITEMERRLAPLADACDHAAVFSLAYLRTTETYLETARTPGFYDDPGFVNHWDVTFAVAYYFAYDNWVAGHVERVPPAWRIAFQAGRERRVSGSGDLLLGISAHVNRDLPFVLAEIGLTAPDGTSRKKDHDRVNVMLNKVFAPLMEEQAARFDPTMASTRTPYQLGYTGLMQMLVAWREAAWRNAERLVGAPDAAARDRVARSIEAQAAATAHSIVAATQYTPPLTSTADRDSYCAGRRR
ncbi:MAG TPA: DUF5995 family protein [Nocardioidaceae bacterium]|nr:DUF5995 family protein [Nocardioidaceae bacterium]